MMLDDLIILGRAAPEPIRNGRITVCIAGYSWTHGFIRIYPSRVDSPLKRWNIVRVPVERNIQDNRQESWKIQGSKSEWGSLSEKIECEGKVRPRDRRQIIANMPKVGCIEDLNDAKKSLGITKPQKIDECDFTTREDYRPWTQLTLDGKLQIKTKKHQRYVPKIKYTCSECKTKQGFHNQQVLEWGVYEWMRKNPENMSQVWNNLFDLYSAHKQDIYFFVGNQVARRTSFMIISILRVSKGPTMKPLNTWMK